MKHALIYFLILVSVFAEDQFEKVEKFIQNDNIVVSDDLLIIGYFVIDKEANEITKKVMLSAEHIASTYEDEVTAFQKRKQLVNSLVDKFSR